MTIAQIVGALAALAFLAVSTSTGLRLLKMWHRTRQAPELLIAIGLLGTGPFGFGPTIAAELMSSEVAAAQTRLLATIVVSVASIAFFGFTATVFRSGVFWARALTASGVLAFVVLCALSVQGHLSNGPGSPDPAMLPRAVVLSIGWGWMGIECVRYWIQASRRVSIGLMDPIVANRFLLWGIVSIESVVTNLVSTVLSARAGVGGMGGEWAILVVGLFGLVGALAILLAFLPPARYRRWIRARGMPEEGCA